MVFKIYLHTFLGHSIHICKAMHVVLMHVTGCVLGLEAFALDPAVLKKFDSMASGKILLAEILEREDIPLMVLYDTSQEDDINVNASCLKALQEKSFESPLQVPNITTG